MPKILEITNLTIKADEKEIIKNLDLSLEKGKVYALFGPNGSGKSTLVNSIISTPGYKISGQTTFENKDITDKTLDQRAKLGINISFQNTPKIHGVTLKNMINLCLNNEPEQDLDKKILELVKKFNLKDFLNRDINDKFSGGEKKKADILQLILLKPKLLILDEPDSGVDVESLKTIAKEINNYVQKNKATVLIITHHGEVLEYIKPDTAFVLIDGKICCNQNPKKTLEQIKKHGYKQCLECTSIPLSQRGGKLKV